MSYTVTFTNPRENYEAGGCSEAVPLADLQCRFQFDVVSSVGMAVRHDIASKYGLETDHANNPLQVNSTFTITDPNGATVFRGVVTEKPTTKSVTDLAGNTQTYLTVEGMGEEGVLLDTLVPDAAGNETWTRGTSTFLVGAAPAMPLVPSSEYGTFACDTLWPDPGDAEGAKCYIQDADCAQDTIAANILAGDAAPFYIELTTTDKGFPPQGWIEIQSLGGNERMYYEGYDPTGGGSKYRVHIKARAELGTTAIDHTAGDTAYAKLAKRIGPQTPIVYRDDGGGAVRMRFDKDYQVLPGYGCFVLTEPAGTDTFTGTYYVYDEDASLDAGSTILYLEDLIMAMVTAPAAYGGAGFSSAKCDFDVTGVGITRYDYDRDKNAPTAWNAISELIQMLNLDDEIKFSFKHSTGKFRLAQLGNAAVADHTITGGMTWMQADMSRADVASTVSLAYSNDQDPNLIQQDYSYHIHPAAAGAAPDAWWRVYGGGEDFHATEYDELLPGDPPDPTFGADMLTDGKNETKLFAKFEHDPGDEFDFGHYWFAAGAPPVKLDYLELWINSYRVIENWGRTRYSENFEYIVRVDGCDDYDTGTNTGTWVELGGEIIGTPSPDGTAVKLEMNGFVLPRVNAIRIVFEYMAGPKQSGDFYWACIHQLIVRGDITKYVLVQTSDQAGDQCKPEFVYAPNSHKKLRGGVNSSGGAGCPKVSIVENIGPASQGAALTVARAHLTGALRLYSQRQYTTAKALAAWPELGDTIDTDGEYTGVCRGFDATIAPSGTRRYQYQVLDYDADYIE